EETLANFTAAGLLQWYGHRIGLSTFGIRAKLLLEALNGGDASDVYRRLTPYDSTLRMYELVREGMTHEFLRSINDRPGFARLYFCSPWISLHAKQEAMLAHAVVQAEKRGPPPELFLITRPVGAGRLTPPETIKPFRDLAATVFLNRRLHTKLYIREPDQSGGYSMAIVGSQNLTKSQHIELGIRINADSVMVNHLIGYFWELANASQEA
ncbi:MAG: hypothetical protein ACREQB_05995, partial [Candidatus Binataceae bacterium]